MDTCCFSQGALKCICCYKGLTSHNTHIVKSWAVASHQHDFPESDAKCICDKSIAYRSFLYPQNYESMQNRATYSTAAPTCPHTSYKNS